MVWLTSAVLIVALTVVTCREQRISCAARSKCGRKDRPELAYVDRNCFCDEMCATYGDCCRDRDRILREEGRLRNAQIRSSCRRVMEISPDHEVNFVETCPTNWSEDFVRSQCENEAVGDDGIFETVPVFGAASRILYRNIFCALCASEANATFWKVRLSCSESPWSQELSAKQVAERTLSSKNHASLSCLVRYFHPLHEARACKSYINRCDKRFSDKVVRKKCRSHTAYVYVEKRVFKNKFCAQCMFFNASQWSCEDTRTPRSPHTNGDDDTTRAESEDTSPFVVEYDLNDGTANVEQRAMNGAEERRESVELGGACDVQQIWDAFEQRCRIVECSHPLLLRGDRCVEAITSATSSVPRPPTTRSSIPRPNSRTDPEDDDRRREPCRNPRTLSSTQYWHAPKNDSIFVYDLRRFFPPSRYRFNDNNEIVLCEPDLYPRRSGSPGEGLHFVEMFRFSQLQGLVFFVGAVVCASSLFVQIVVYACLRELSDVSGRCISSLSAALMFAQILLLLGLDRNEDARVCFGCAVALHYFLLAAFFWMNVLAVDVCSAFRVVPAVPSSTSCCTCRMWLYSLYAWLFPALIVGSAVFLELGSSFAELVNETYRPHYGLRGLCWITYRYALLFLFAVPIGFVLLFNIFVYVITLRRMCVTPADDSCRVTRRNRQRFIVYIKLSFIMAVTWVFGFISTFTPFDVLWFVFAVFNCLQGVFVLIAFVVNKRVYKILCRKGGSNAAHNRYDGFRGRGLLESKVIAQETSI